MSLPTQSGRFEAPQDAGASGGGPGGTSERAGARKGFLLRLPPELLAELRSWANQEIRSLNGHIAYLLQEAVRRRKNGSGGG